MSTRPRASWLVYLLGALSIGAVVAAVLVVGPAPASQSSITRTATVSRGVVQSTVSGSGNLEPASQLDLGFRTSGTVTHIYVTQGEHVIAGQLLATLDPQSAEVTLEQAKASLQSAEANLAREEETDGEGTSASSSGDAGSGQAASAASAHAAATGTTPSTTTPAATTAPATTTTTTTTPSATTTPAATTPGASEAPTSTTPSSKTRSKSTTTPANSGGDTSSETKTSTISSATREANLASAKAAVKSDRLTVQSDEQAVQDTKLYAPEAGTIASLSGQVGEVVTGSGTSRATPSSSSSSDSSAATGASASRAASSSSDASSSSSSSGSSFAVLTNLSSMQLVVPLSESEVGDVHDGQVATVTVEALEGRKLAAHVQEVAILSTSNSGVVSYDVTFQLDQLTSGIKPGMSATAEVVVKQAEGVNVPTSAISGGSVTVLADGKRVRRRVVTGLAGNSTTIVLSGLSAGETVLLPTAASSSASKGVTSLLRDLRGGSGGLGGTLGGGGGAFPGGGGPGAFRGGG